jgi:signal transduction histidine kinase
MTIRLRITLLIILTFLAISAIGGYAVLQSRRSAVEVKSVTEGVVPSALASADLVSQLKEVQLTAMAIVTAPDNDIAAQANDKLSARKAGLDEALALQKKHADNAVQRGLVDQARESMDNYNGAIDDSVKAKLAGKTELAQATFFGNVVPYAFELEQIVDTLRIEKNRSKDAAIATLNANLATTTQAISGVTVVAVLILTAIGLLLSRQITGPISRMQGTMSEIATSQDFTRRVPVDRMDEIGHSIVAFNGMIGKIEEGAALLRQKSADVETMLQNIPQGILTIIDDNRVHPEYSAYLETLLETTDIVGRDVMELVFSNTSLGADTLSQMAAIGGACVGEDVMNFAFNEHLMVGEIEKTMADGRVKILDLSWSPITDDADMIVRLMLCLRDVTELRSLAAEANEQRRELEIIGEILAVSQEKFHAFITDAQVLIDANEAAVLAHPERDDDVLALLFRNMHTVKGNGRTYGLLHLANQVHEAEEHYDALRDPNSGLIWDQAELLAQLVHVKAKIARYARINEVSLGRKGPGRRGGIERYLMIDKKQIADSLHRLENVNTANLHELVAVRNSVRQTLRLLGTESLAEALSGVLDSLPVLAVELGKKPPLVEIDDGGYVIHNQVGGLFKNVFMHLIRNAVDHGLESAEVRTALGKPAAGNIRLATRVDGAMLQLALSDDGRGLALARIRAMAIAKEFLAEDELLSDEEAAAMIFRPGFSTAETVTSTSGRGVGLDAVRDFVKREHGDISIAFTDDAVGAAFRQFRILVSLPAGFAAELNDAPDELVQQLLNATPASAARGMTGALNI